MVYHVKYHQKRKQPLLLYTLCHRSTWIGFLNKTVQQPEREEHKMNEYVIQTSQLTKRYGTIHALDHVNIHVKKGCIYGLIGDNGSGKSTLLKLLAGQSHATSGEITMLGASGEKELERARRHIGCIIESPGFFPNMTVEQTLNYYSIQKGVPDDGKIIRTMQITGIEEKRRQKCRTLSLGQKQKLGLAIALLGEPQLLILDEPVNGLDPGSIIEFRSLLHRLNTEKNITILLSSHILSELQQTANVYGFLNKGKLLEEISAAALNEKCMDCIEITVSDPESYAAALETAFPSEHYKVLPDHTIRIYTPQKKAEAYSRLAREYEIDLTGMQTIRTSLENYYMELKKSSN